MEYILNTHGLTKQYGALRAVDNVDMRIPNGSIYGFVGKNGAGKTTLIRMVTGLISATSGDITLYGHSGKDILKGRKRIAAVVETPSLYLGMTAYQNLKMQCLVLGVDDKCINEVLETVNLAYTGEKLAKDFSLGMKQRLGIAVALLGDPSFLILDEPTNGLDPAGIVEVRELLIKLNRERKITMLVSSHILSELERLATYYGFIDSGRLLKEISAAELEATCRRTTVLYLSNTAGVATPLASLGLTDYKVVSDYMVEVYAEVPVSKLVFALDKVGIVVNKMTEREVNLENYYFSLIGGAKHV